MQNCHAVPDKGSSHIVWTHHLSRLDSRASLRPASHYTGKYPSESETEHKTQKLSFQGNLGYEQKHPFQTQVTGQHPNDTEQKNAQHDTRNIHEPLSWVFSYTILKSGNFQHFHCLNTQPNTSQASAATQSTRSMQISALPLPCCPTIIATEQGSHTQLNPAARGSNN